MSATWQREFTLPDGAHTPGEGGLTVILQAHNCDRFCHGLAFCEECGTQGTDTVLWIGTTPDGLQIVCCQTCLPKVGLEPVWR